MNLLLELFDRSTRSHTADTKLKHGGIATNPSIAPCQSLQNNECCISAANQSGQMMGFKYQYKIASSDAVMEQPMQWRRSGATLNQFTGEPFEHPKLEY
jgi:hypothetical protein